jgi:hypothetical protein
LLLATGRRSIRLVGTTVDFFISYTSKDKACAEWRRQPGQRT